MTTRTISILAPLAEGGVQAAPLPKELNQTDYARIFGFGQLKLTVTAAARWEGALAIRKKQSLRRWVETRPTTKEPNSVHGDPKNAEAIQEPGTDFVSCAH